ncbi:thyrotropin-releasing hormone-degrading ectoenzyme-like isoform X2 [Odontomachus brunneus]|uniref:thyrotropin-releasing hormone-degrading ectoenzyme-like isoform X2 n=1 Tax=Odontomachus brunneus TaxID=486640 RepID=UPI0013F1EAC6|nr:thyrotropin-releasing hormone-degrading ectoenzyme-like isoform X2 [Odontomachus brunneus]
MMFLKLLLSVTVIFTGNQQIIAVINRTYDHCKIASPYDNIPLNETTPTLYNIDLNMENNLVILGESNIFLTVSRTTKRIILHACELQIDVKSIVLTSQSITTYGWDIRHEYYQYVYCQIAQNIELIFKDDINPGKYNLRIKFKLPSTDNKDLIFYDQNFWLPMIRTELNSARRIFPCWDNPGAKARFNISVKHSVSYTILSNMPVSHVADEQNGMKRIYFTKTPMIAPREVAIALVANVNSKRSYITSGVTLWYRQQVDDNHLEYMFHTIENCKKIFDTYIGNNKMTLKTDYVLVPNIPMKVMGYPGLVICRERDFTYNVDSDYSGRKSLILNLLGQEMARRWFGGIISPSSWSEVLSSQIIASFLHLILTENLQNKAIQNLYAVQIVQSTFHHDFALNMKSLLYKIDSVDKIEKDLYFRMYCNKGVALLRMLYYLISPDNFRTAIQTYFINNDHTSFKLNNLWNIVLAKENNVWVHGIQEVIDKWLMLSSIPLVYVDHNNKSNTVYISTDNYCDYCILPITYITKSNLNSGYAWNVTWLDSFETKTISKIADDDFIIVNLEQSGYYRVNYNLQNWLKIISYLSVHDYTLIHVNNRAQLIDDAFYFTMQGQLVPSVFSKLISSYLPRETSYIAWYPLFNIMLRMSTFLQLPEGEDMRKTILNSLGTLLKIIGYKEDFNEDNMMKSLRLLAVRWACRLGLKECKDAASSRLLIHFNMPYIPILSWWEEWVYCTGMETASLGTWRKWMNKCIIKQNETCFTYLACAGKEDVLNYYLLMLLGIKKMDEFMKEAGILTLFHTLFKKQASNYCMLTNFVKNQNKINNKIYGHDVDLTMLLREVIGTIYTEDGLKMIICGD